MNSKPLAYLVFFVAMLSSVLAFEDFTATSQFSYSLCPCSGEGYPVFISNTGASLSTYSLSINQEVQSWTTITPQSFSLNPGKTARVVVYINSPCSQNNSLPFTLRISTAQGLTKALSQLISFRSCYGFSIIPGVLINSSANQTHTTLVFAMA